MKITEQKQKADEMMKLIVVEAWKDESFKEELKENPKATLEKFFEKKFNLDKDIKVIDQTNSDYFYINIPAKPNMENIELSEDQLEKIAGGGNILEDAWEAFVDFNMWLAGDRE